MIIQALIYVNMTAAEEDGLMTFVWVGYAVEAGFAVVTMIFCIPMTMHILTTSSAYHPNVTKLYYVNILYAYLFMLSRIPLAYYELNYEFRWLIEDPPAWLCVASQLRTNHLAILPATLTGILLERVAATALAATYEVQYYPRAFNGAQVVMRINERKRTKLSQSVYSLSRRYQITENVKALRVLNLFTWFCTVMNFIFAVLFVGTRLPIPWFYRNILGVLASAFTDIYVFMCSFVGYLGNQRMKKLAMQIAANKIHEITNGLFFKHLLAAARHRRDSNRVLDVNGKAIYLGAKQQDYFSQLDAQWK
ncbi:unnamed protein product, partial [Mesorhabditis spiculigera]